MISSNKTTGKENIKTNFQSFKLRGTVLKICSKKGTYNIMQCKDVETIIATHRIGLLNSKVESIDCSSLKAFNALNISIITKTVNERVEAFCFPHEKYRQEF